MSEHRIRIGIVGPTAGRSRAGMRDGDRAFVPLAPPEASHLGFPQDPVPGNVARTYARMAADLRTGSRTAPTFDDAVELHRLIAAIEEPSASGARVHPNAPNRPLQAP